MIATVVMDNPFQTLEDVSGSSSDEKGCTVTYGYEHEGAWPWQALNKQRLEPNSELGALTKSKTHNCRCMLN